MTGVLMEALVEEVLLRFPPDDPASLVRAALVSKRWCRLIAGRGFRRRFRELHRADVPMLGFICNLHCDQEIKNSEARLVPTSSCLPRADYRGWRALDSRCGRVLLDMYMSGPMAPLVVWNAVTGEHLILPFLPLERRFRPPFTVNATVLCAGGDHLDGDCHHGSFLVAFVGTYMDGVFTYLYSSDAGAWSEASMAEKNPIEYVDSVPAALVGNAVHFLVSISERILKYDLGTRENSFLQMPPESYGYQQNMVMTTEQGKLGLARLNGFRLYLWSMEEVGSHGDAVWTQDWVVELRNLLPADALLNRPAVLGCVHDRRGVVLVGTRDVALFAIDPKLNQAIKVGEGMPFKDDEVGFRLFYVVLPYSSFYFPALGAVRIAEEPSAGASSA